MELVRILMMLWTRRRWLLVGLVVAACVAISSIYDVSLDPLRLKSEAFEYGSASTQVLVDSRLSPIGDLTLPFGPLQERANVYARLMTSPAAVGLIGREAGIKSEIIVAQGPFNLKRERVLREPTAERRGVQLLTESVGYRLRFEAEADIPVVTIFSQAPTGKEAIRLANGAAKALETYLNDLQDRQRTPASRRVIVRELGEARGGDVNSGTDHKAALLTFGGLLLMWCVLILFVTSLKQNWRESRLDDNRSLNGDGGRASIEHRERVLR